MVYTVSLAQQEDIFRIKTEEIMYPILHLIQFHAPIQNFIITKYGIYKKMENMEHVVV